MSDDRSSRPLDEAEVFSAAAAAVARGDDLDETLAELLGLAVDSAGAARGAVYVADHDRDVLELSVTYLVPEGAAASGASVEGMANGGGLGEAARSRRPLAVADASKIAVLAGCAGGLLVPLVVRRDGSEVLLGVMALGFGGPIPTGAETSVEPLADLGAVAVERALTISAGSERTEWFDRLASTDLVTGLPNRRMLDQVLEMEIVRAARQGVTMNVALLRVDRLEDIRGSSGNGRADEALKRVAQVLVETIRLVDTVGRFADDQFLLVAPGAEGMTLVERLVKGVATLPGAEDQALSVSAGLACFPHDGRTPAELIAAAEQALSAAQAAGGNAAPARKPAGK